MMRIQLQTPTQKSIIHCERGCFQTVTPTLLDGHQNFVLTDSNVYQIYKEDIQKVFGDTPLYILPAGEESKTFLNLQSILEKMIEAGLHRNSYLFALGGGVVGDIGGLAASLYMRGIHCVQLPTTLLSQVDSSVGGKTAVDMGRVKNVVGAFYQPETVLVDGNFLKTLPVREIRCGLGEIVKYGGLNGKIFDSLWAKKDGLFDLEYLAEITPLCIEHKAEVVRKDERERGLRKSLNMGHTTGHALELYFGNLSHGEFVLVGMYYELKIALDLGMVAPDYAQKLMELIERVLVKIPKYDDVEGALALAKMDKKNTSTREISLIVPKAYNEYVEVKMPFESYQSRVQRYAK